MKARTFLVLYLALASVTAQAGNRGISKGSWHTGEFCEPAYAARWGYGDTESGAKNSLSADKQLVRAGSGSIRYDSMSGFDCWAYFPNTKDLDLDVSACKSFKFSMKSENKHDWGADPQVIFIDMAGKKARFDGIQVRLPRTLREWVDFSVPVGPNAQSTAAEYGWKAVIEPGFSWKHLGCFQLHQDTGDHGFIMWHDGAQFSAEKPVKWWLSSTYKPDLTITYAEQLPHYPRYFPNYDKKYPEIKPEDQSTKHWPDPGEKVKYVVHVRNVGFTNSKRADFRCTIAGKVVKVATIPALKPRQEMTVVVPWQWKQGPYQFSAVVDTKNRMDEISKKNNVHQFKTDAYTLVAICEKGIIKPVDSVNSFLGSFSYEDWLRGATADTINALFRHSKYDFAPNGATISVRMGKIILIDEFKDDTTRQLSSVLDNYDGTWTYPTRAVTEWCNLANTYHWALVHEITHQLGIIDNYQMDLGADNNKINGKPFGQPEGGIMGGGHIGTNTQPAYADVDVAGMNLTKGHRRGYFGEYLFNIPKKNTLILTADGKPFPDADIQIYQKSMDTGIMAGDPVLSGRSDSQGRFALANRPVPKEYTTATGSTLKPNPFGYPDVVARNGLFLVRANSGGKWYYGFIDIGDFVVEYARGHKGTATYPLELKAE